MTNGVKLLPAIRRYLIPITCTNILDIIDSLSDIQQKNAELIDSFFARAYDLFTRLKTLKYNNFDKLHIAYVQQGILCRAYGKHKSLNFFHNKLNNDKDNLENYNTLTKFKNRLEVLFKAEKILVDGKLLPLSNNFTCLAGIDFKDYVETYLTLGIRTDEDIMTSTMKINCLLCLYLKNHKLDHNFNRCPQKKIFGFGNIDYNPLNDQRLTEEQQEQKRNKWRKFKNQKQQLGQIY